MTQETVNVAQKAHIYSFSEKGPRGWGPFINKTDRLNDISNLMLMCYGCHKKIDQDEKGIRYSPELLIDWKKAHEQRVEWVTEIHEDKKSHVILFSANIGSEKSLINNSLCVEAMFPYSYPASQRPTVLSMTSALKDCSSEYWLAESSNLFNSYKEKIVPLIEHDTCKNFSLFALAPQPLLIKLGALLTDKINVDTFQLHREPHNWKWQTNFEKFNYIIKKPSHFKNIPVLKISLSDHVSDTRITNLLGNGISIWELTTENPNNDFMKSKKQLSMFRENIRSVMIEIKEKHGNIAPLHIFPVMPISCAIELGRIRMPKADTKWLIYDQDLKTQIFKFSLVLDGDIHSKKMKNE